MAYWMPTREQWEARKQWEQLPKTNKTVPPEWVIKEMLYDGGWGAAHPCMYSAPISRRRGESDEDYTARIICHMQNGWQHSGQ